MFKNLLAILLLAVLLPVPVALSAETTLAVTGEVKTPLKLTLAEIEAMPSQTIAVKDHDGTTATYEGTALHNVLVRAGVPQGESLRGEAMRLCVLVKASDGYQVVFALAELDPRFTDKTVLMAFRRDGKELDAKSGPLRLIIPDEKHQGRWVREVNELEVVRVGTNSNGRSNP